MLNFLQTAVSVQDLLYVIYALLIVTAISEATIFIFLTSFRRGRTRRAVRKGRYHIKTDGKSHTVSSGYVSQHRPRYKKTLDAWTHKKGE